MNRYFKNFPTIAYPIDINDASAGTVDITDLTVRFNLKRQILENPHAYYNYAWRDGDRPDTVAYDYYGDANLAWLVLLSAEAFDYIYDFPMDTDVFHKYLEEKYSASIEELSSTIHHYEDTAGFIVDLNTYMKDGGEIVSVYEYEEEANESRRIIKLISSDFVPQIINELREGLKKATRANEEALLNERE